MALADLAEEVTIPFYYFKIMQVYFIAKLACKASYKLHNIPIIGHDMLPVLVVVYLIYKVNVT